VITEHEEHQAKTKKATQYMMWLLLEFGYAVLVDEFISMFLHNLYHIFISKFMIFTATLRVMFD